MSTAEDAGESELDESRAPFLEHLTELRWRLWRAIVGLFVAACICFMFHDYLYALLTAPLYEVLEAKELDTAVKFRTVHGAFMFHLKTAVLGGIFVAIPIILWQAWGFIAPGLYKHERRKAIPFVFLMSVCFIGGGVFAYQFVLPPAFDFLLSYGIDGPRRLVPDITIEDYLGFTTKLLLAFGLVFELPVGIGFMAMVGLVTHRGLIAFWRWAIVVAFVLGAMLTPPDYYTQIMLAGSLLTLYVVSIGVAYVITKSREAVLGDEPDPAEDTDAVEDTDAAEDTDAPDDEEDDSDPQDPST